MSGEISPGKPQNRLIHANFGAEIGSIGVGDTSGRGRKWPLNALHPLTVTVIPPCESIMVIGKNPRNIKCTSNPFTINVTPLDRELIVRGDTSVYQPKKIMLNAKEIQDESIQIILEEN